MNNVVVTVLYLLWALHRRIIVYHILYKKKHLRASLATAIYDNKQSDCLLSRSQGLIGLEITADRVYLIKKNAPYYKLYFFLISYAFVGYNTTLYYLYLLILICWPTRVFNCDNCIKAFR